MIYFTADPHFGHQNIIKYCKRPFKNHVEMDAIIKAHWNALVTPKDTVYVLGDFSMSSDKNQLEDWFNALNGQKILIVGNHDSRACLKLPWKEVHDVKLIQYKGYRIWLSHYAHRTWPHAFHGSLHLFGHSHGMLDDYRRSMDVGVDSHGFKPLSGDQVIEMLSEKEITS